MKSSLIKEVQHAMLGVLDQRQQEFLKTALLRCLEGYEVIEIENRSDDAEDNFRLLDAFLSASEKGGRLFRKDDQILQDHHRKALDDTWEADNRYLDGRLERIPCRLSGEEQFRQGHDG